MMKSLILKLTHRLANYCRLRHTLNLKPFWGCVVVLAIALVGCVDADIGVRFDSPNRGEIMQQIQLNERLKNTSGTSLQDWTRMLEQRAAAVGGKVQKSSQGLNVKIPFTSSAELAQKFNQFFAVFNQAESAPDSRLPAIESQLIAQHSNFLLLQRDRLTYEVDLRSLGVSTNGNVLVSPATLINLQFQLETPWGARSMVKPNTLRPLSLKGGKKLIWTLTPGAQNTIETVFWMPQPLGIGAVAIALLVVVGKFFKYPQVETKNQYLRTKSQVET